MNSTIKQLQTRKSVRNFTGGNVSETDLRIILETAQQAPNSVNGQQTSLVVIKDKETIKKIAEIAGGQPQIASADIFVVIIADYRRAMYAAKKVNKKHLIKDSAEGILVGAVDAGIMLNAIQTAAESLGYGTTAIGGMRRDPDAMIELLGLPEGTYPVVGTTIGIPNLDKESKVKPRVPYESFVHNEKYNLEAVEKGVDEYDDVLRKWWDGQGLVDMPDYSNATAQYYETIYFPTIAKTMKKQGFEFKDEE